MRGTLTLLNKWDARWLEIAGVVSTWSKDPSTKIGAIAGCRVVEGSVNRQAKVRVMRNDETIHDGEILSLKREKNVI